MRVPTIFRVAMLCVFCLLIGCSPTPQPIVDTQPIGDGLQFIGIAAVIVAIVFVIGAAVVEDSDE